MMHVAPELSLETQASFGSEILQSLTPIENRMYPLCWLDGTPISGVVFQQHPVLSVPKRFR